jgi:hypothetical protein
LKAHDERGRAASDPVPADRRPATEGCPRETATDPAAGSTPVREVRQAGAFELSVERSAMKPSELNANTTRSSRKAGWSPAPWYALRSRSWPRSGKPNKTCPQLMTRSQSDHRGRTGMAAPPRRRHPGDAPWIRHGARGVSWTRSTARQRYELSIGWIWVPWSPPNVSLEGGAMSSVLVAGTPDVQAHVSANVPSGRRRTALSPVLFHTYQLRPECRWRVVLGRPAGGSSPPSFASWMG